MIVKCYRCAKNQARIMGDSTKANAYLFKELQYERKKLLESCWCSAKSGCGTLKKSLLEGLQGFSKGFFEITTGYFLKPMRLIAAALTTVILFAVTYCCLDKHFSIKNFKLSMELFLCSGLPSFPYPFIGLLEYAFGLLFFSVFVAVLVRVLGKD